MGSASRLASWCGKRHTKVPISSRTGAVEMATLGLKGRPSTPTGGSSLGILRNGGNSDAVMLRMGEEGFRIVNHFRQGRKTRQYL